MSQDLFRPEVIQARRTGWLGGIVLAQPTRLWVLAVCAAAAAATLVMFLVFGSYTRRTTVSGTLVPTKGLAVVVAPVSGVVSALNINEGESVRKGQAVAVVTVPRATVAVGDTTKAIERRLQERQRGLDAAMAAQMKMYAAQEAGILSQLNSARRESAGIEAEIQTRREQIRIAEETLTRLRQLEDEQYVSILQIKQEQSNALGWKGELQSFQRQAIANERLVTQLEQNLRELPEQRRVAEADYRRNLALLEQERVQAQANGALSVTAPVQGLVTVQMAKPGQAIEQGQPLLVLLPAESALEAELHVPSRAIGFVEPGDTVLLRYQAYPYQKFGHHQATVVRISRSTMEPGQVDSNGQAGAAEAYYRVTVRLARQTVQAYGREERLMPGMQVDADILGERRRLIEWLLEPVYSIKGVSS